MKIPIPERSLERDLAEFDVWITPSLGEIRDTERFQEELEKVASIFDLLVKATDGFADVAHCTPDAIAGTIAEKIDAIEEPDAIETLDSLASVLFLVTGKSDNNAKCQLPLYLRDVAKWPSFPAVRRQREKVSVKAGPIPRELTAEKYMKVVACLREHPEQQQKLLREFISFLLSDENYVSQFWSIGHSYATLSVMGKERSLLTPLVVFQVRGSVSASGGHGPEELLRDLLKLWGLAPQTAFNTSDVVVGNNSSSGGKTRAYDFVLPYKIDGWRQRLLIQCQFYAGDSGSVSHKNVDQTSSSRLAVEKELSDIRFIEYVDGAGYFSSLNRDLKSLLGMESTSSFFQVRSAPIRLRRELQHIGFLTPLEIEHAVLRTDGQPEAVADLIATEGYDASEIERAMEDAVRSGVLNRTGDVLELAQERVDVVRQYFLLDVAASEGHELERSEVRGSFLVPGYGPFHGMKLDDLVAKAAELAPALESLWNSPQAPLTDIRVLCEAGYAMSS